jgi:aspartate kinase
MNPAAQGTRISDEADDTGGIIKAVAAKDNITAVKIKSGKMLMAYGFMRKIFEIFEEYHTPVDMVSTSEVAVSLTIDDATHLDRIVEALQNYGYVEVDKNMTIVIAVGSRIAESHGVAGHLFSALSQVPIRMISFGGSRHNISFLINGENKKAALEALNSLFDK